MATLYPTSLDSYSTKSAGDTISEAHINDPQDAIEALETKVGIDSSAVSTSHDYKLTVQNSWTDNTSSNGLYLNKTGVLSGGAHGLYIYSNAAHTTADSALVKFVQDNASASQ